jgi:formylglycine-generating enzyme required for sulfatase activity
MPRVFLSYRREDSAYAAQGIFKELETAYGSDSVFMDVHSIPFALDFRQQLIEAVSHCELFVAIIGTKWLTATLDGGRRCLDDSRDYVRIEIEAAFEGGMTVLPVLVDSATMPGEELLPHSLRDLAYLNAFELPPDRSFHEKLKQIVEVIENCVSSGQTNRQRVDSETPPSPLRSFVPKKYSMLIQSGQYFSNAAGVRLRIIPPGEFWMGSPDSDEHADEDERPQHLVRLTRPFLMSVYCVTQEQFEVISGANYRLERGMELHPAVNVSWFDAVQFCNRLSRLEGLLPCYQTEKGSTRIESTEGYRLPTEAEWEYACRAGSTTKWAFGDDVSDLDQYACFDQPSVSPVGTKKPNDWGLFDMHGCVWEWCWDWFTPQYETLESSSQRDPRGLVSGEERVIRGGSFFFKAWNTRSAYRMSELPHTKNDNISFRVARSLGKETA